MALDPGVVGSVQALAGGLSLLFLKPALENRGKPGSDTFAVFVAAVALWSFGLAAGNFTGDYALSVGAYNVVLLAGEVAGVAWFALAARLTGRVSLSRRLVATLAGSVVLLQVLVWTNPVHSLVYVPRAPAGGVVLGVEYGVGFWIHAGGAYLLGLVGTGLFALEALQSTGVRRTQTLLLALAAVPIVVANLASTSARRPGSSSPRSRPRSGRSSTTPTNWTPR